MNYDKLTKYQANKMLLKYLEEIINNSPDVDFNNILLRLGVTDHLVILDDNDEENELGAHPLDETSQDTLKRIAEFYN